LLDRVLPNEVQKIEERTVSIGQQFMECVVFPGENWVLITQFDVSLSNSPLDNCNYPVQNLAPETSRKEKQRDRNSLSRTDSTSCCHLEAYLITQ
jgi:hypothetical protein